MLSHLAYITKRSYVFDDYTWSRLPLPCTVDSLSLRPTRIPLNAFISGPAAGGLTSTSSSTHESLPRAVHREFWELICPTENRHVISAADAPYNSWGSVLLKWWKEEIQKHENVVCLEVDTRPRPVFDFK